MLGQLTISQGHGIGVTVNKELIYIEALENRYEKALIKIEKIAKSADKHAKRFREVSKHYNFRDNDGLTSATWNAELWEKHATAIRAMKNE